jgi:hypothetical protein
MRKLGLLVATAIGAMGLLAPVAARAHFRLTAPAASYNQNGQGDPQKSAPCGQADNMLQPPGLTAVATNMVTPFTAGQTITITLTETIPHPGHFRVALSTNGLSGLPADPPVTAVGNDQCGMTTIMNPPVYPVLADGALRHTTALAGTQSIQVTLPANMTCTSNCVLQVIQYMSSHGAPCFYHHCANITIAASTAGTGGSGGAGGTGAAGSGGRGGAGGAGGRGGASGAAGGTAGTGGATGLAGSGGGGAGPGVAGQGGGAAGVSGAAGAVAGSGGATGVSGSWGGSPTGSGGAAGNSAAGTAGSGTPPPADDSGCALAGGHSGPTSVTLLMLLVVAARMSRRHRRRRR